MAVVAGTRYSFTDTANNAIDMSDTLAMISPSDVPLLSIIGKDSLSKACTATKHEWLEDSLRPLDFAVANDTSLNNTTDPVTFNVASGQGVRIAAGDILRVESELLRVTSVSSDAITVARGFGGSTAAAHAANTPGEIVGTVSTQGAAVGPARTTTKTGLYNYTQIYNSSVEITSTQRSTDKWVGPANELARLLDNEMRVAWQVWERALLHGRKVAPSSGVASAMDGILVRLSTNAYAKSGAALSEDFILQALQDIWTAGGRPSHMFLNAFQKRAANKFLDSYRQTTRTDRIAGAVVDTYTSDFGTVDIVLDRNMPTDTVLIIDRSKIGFGPLQGNALQAKLVPTTTYLKETWQVFGEYTAEVRNENAHAKITGLATS
jgi:hypothetical protein